MSNSLFDEQLSPFTTEVHSLPRVQQTDIVEANLKNRLPLQAEANEFNLLNRVYCSITKNLNHDFL